MARLYCDESCILFWSRRQRVSYSYNSPTAISPHWTNHCIALHINHRVSTQNKHLTKSQGLTVPAMSFTLSIQQGPARIAQQRLLPALSKSAFRTSMRSFHHQTPKPTSAFFTSRVASATTRHGFARSYYQEASTRHQAAASGTGLRKLLVGGAIFGGTLVAINAVFNRETREDGGMPLFEREYLNNTFLHTGLGVGIIGLTARQMVQTGFVYRLMVTNPWVVGLGGLALSFATMIGTRSISPDK